MSHQFEEAVRGEAMPLLHDENETSIYYKMLDLMEKPLLMAAMDECWGNQTKVAERLGINRATLRTKLKRHGIKLWSKYDRLAGKYLS